MVLNEQNLEQVRRILTEAATTSKIVEFVEGELRTLRTTVAQYEDTLKVSEHERARYGAELKQLGFHDVGHARTEFEQMERKNAENLHQRK